MRSNRYEMLRCVVGGKNVQENKLSIIDIKALDDASFYERTLRFVFTYIL